MTNENITYCVDDNNLDGYNDSESEIENSELAALINEFEQMQSNSNNSANLYNEDDIMSEMQNYELNFTIKQLLLICEYYGISKQAKNAECYGSKARTMKKSDIISLIMMFEKNIDNIETVMKRKELWFYLDSLKADKIMKKFVLW
jgi:hypothetical protein